MEILLKNKLFEGLTLDEVKMILKHLEAEAREYKKDEVIINQGDPIEYFYIVLSGTIRVVKYDILGNMNIINFLNPPDTFGEAFYESGLSSFPVSAVGNTRCKIMSLKFDNIYSLEDGRIKSLVLKNLITLLSRKNIFLRNKLDIKSLPTIRQRVLFYLQDVQSSSDDKYFEINFNITEFANFLGVNRSSLSRELSKMKREGIIDYDGKTYKIKRAV